MLILLQIERVASAQPLEYSGAFQNSCMLHGLGCLVSWSELWTREPTMCNCALLQLRTLIIWPDLLATGLYGALLPSGNQACYLPMQRDPGIGFPLHQQHATVGSDVRSHSHDSCQACVAWQKGQLLGSHIRSHHAFILTSVRGLRVLFAWWAQNHYFVWTFFNFVSVSS